MSKDNDFEIIDDFGDFSMEPSNDPVVSNEVPSNEVANSNLEEIPSFSFGDFETPVVKKEENIMLQEQTNEQPNTNINVSQEPVTFEFDGFEGVLDNQEKEPQVQPEIEKSNAEQTLEMEDIPKQEEVQMIRPAEPLAAPGTVDVMPATPSLNMDVEPVPTVQQNEEQPVEINPVLPNGEPVVTKIEEKEKTVEKNNGSNKTKLVFIAILFLIIGVVILFLPQISSMLKK